MMRLNFFLAAALGVAAVGPAASAPRSAGLLPLSPRDMDSSRESGCAYSFDVGRRTYVQAIGRELMVRTGNGLKICKVDDAAFRNLTDGIGRAPMCGGYRLSTKRTGRVTHSEEADSGSWPAVLTVKVGTRTVQSLRGLAGVAC